VAVKSEFVKRKKKLSSANYEFLARAEPSGLTFPLSGSSLLKAYG
jgi:hypothetical protein